MSNSVAIIHSSEFPLECKLANNAFAEAGCTVRLVEAGEAVAKDLRSNLPDFVYIALPGNAGDYQLLLEALGIPYIGCNAQTACNLSYASSLVGIMETAASYGEIQSSMPISRCLSPIATASLLEAGAIDALVENLGCDFPLNVMVSHPYTRGLVVRANDEAELIASLRNMAKDDVLVEQAVTGLNLTVGIMGDLDNILILPPFASESNTRIPLSQLSDIEEEAQAIRSEIERTALDAFILCGCRDMATVDLVWDGGRALVLNVDPAPALNGYLAQALETAATPMSEILEELAELAISRS